MSKIYGVDPDKKVTPIVARDAMVACFVKAHSKILEDLKQYSDVSEEEFEKVKRLDVELLVKKFFSDVGGDYDHPTKESLIKVCDKLAEFAKNFRNPKIITKHYNEIMSLIKKCD